MASPPPDLTVAMPCPKCGEELPVSVEIALLGAGHGPDGEYRIGLDAHIGDRAALDKHAHTHDQEQHANVPAPTTEED
ncbi:hypothetical protein [Kineosporia sp. NBRC 101731]|uniref:hypothetical protein n=1 Tax=Kineosporia sp. NBRC 101731 TaxID=3032199 RepID=UPI0024A2A5E7|nr:hypothetical protein [Kineosporia sp. NBRC 101731]GLY32121.1 hypothetical protein Kisp02_54860 [Kineosporia sp. NBRC 101731]